MDRTELMRLAARVEAATGPDRELDEMIQGEVWKYNCRNPIWDCGEVAPFTASIEAAMMLVPDGWHWRLYSNSLGKGPEAQVQKERSVVIATGATTALALVASCLRARVGGEG